MHDDLPPDLHRLEVLRTWHAMWVARIDAKMARLRQEQAQQDTARKAAVERAPDWQVEQGIGEGPAVYVHVGGCHMAGKRCRGVSRDVALRALVEGVDACPHCRPDAELGYLEG